MSRASRSLILTLCAALAPAAQAAPWTVHGPRAQGMGGAFTAVAEGPLGAYWNPAGLGQAESPDGFQLPVSIRGEFTGNVAQGANDLAQLENDCRANPGVAPCNDAGIQQALTAINQKGSGVLVDGAAGMGLKLGRLALFFNELAAVGASPVVDLANNTTLTVANNQSKLVLRGGVFTEFGAGYGRELWDSGLLVGANLKGIVGKIGYHDYRIVSEDPGTSHALKDFDSSATTSFRPAVDLGALWDLRETFGAPMRPRLGVTARNVNSPSFNQPDAAKAAGERSSYPLCAQLRAGAALSPLRFWNLAADLDLTDNLTPVSDFRSRFLSFGTELNLVNRPGFNLPLRAGVSKNVSAGNSGVSWSAGLGLNFLHASFDLAASLGDKRVTLQSVDESKRFPSNAALSAQFALLFGGRDYEPRGRESRSAPPPAAPAQELQPAATAPTKKTP